MPKSTFFNLPEDKRQRIIEVALEEFAAHPYSKASLSSIVNRLGIAKGSMYQYFTDKKDLYQYLMQLAMEEKTTYIKEQGFAPEDNFFTSFEKVFFAGVRFNFAHPQLSQILANSMEPSGEALLQEVNALAKRKALEFFQQMLEQGQKQGAVRQDLDLKLTANLLMAMIGDGLTDYVLDFLGVDLHEMLANPKVVERITTEDLNHIIQEVMKILRLGLERASI